MHAESTRSGKLHNAKPILMLIDTQTLDLGIQSSARHSESPGGSARAGNAAAGFHQGGFNGHSFPTGQR